MSTLRIYSGGTGNLQYDSDGTAKGRQSQKARREFNAGVLLYYAPTRSEFHSYVKLHRGAEEQFLAVYEGGSEDPVAGLKSAVREAADDRGWRVVSASETNQRVFETLGTDRTAEPNVGAEQIRQELEQTGSIDFTAGDARSAVALFEYLRAELPGRTIAITTSGRTKVVENTELVIRIDESHTYSQPTVTADTAKNLHDRQIESDKESLRRRLDQLRDAVGASSSPQPGEELSTALTAAGVPKRFGLSVRSRVAPFAEDELRRRYLTVSFLLLVVSGFLFSAWTHAGVVDLPLGQDLDVSVPFVEPQPSPPSLLVVALSGSVLSAAILSTRTVRRTVAKGVLALESGIERLLSAGGASARHDADRSATQAVADVLGQLQSRATNDDRFVREVTAVLGEYGIEVRTRTEAARQRRLASGVGLLIGSGFGLAFGAGVFFAFRPAVKLVTGHWTWSVWGLAAFAVVVVVVRIALFGYALLAGSNRDRSPEHPRSSRSDGRTGSPQRPPKSSQRSGASGLQQKSDATDSGRDGSEGTDTASIGKSDSGLEGSD